MEPSSFDEYREYDRPGLDDLPPFAVEWRDEFCWRLDETFDRLFVFTLEVLVILEALELVGQLVARLVPMHF